ncbi:hypothetical protein Ahy_B04g069793 [Arachis hypogaea]|uniref:TYRAAT2-like C-terminal domain-containing protein n=1 Tax=Arachis hypogaea TaxID=3818 RepID=A0A444ZDL8_ARAHY|nr:hypothetical protein Ahy_B04g069793 [Arachis hypogaea]
MTKLELGMKNQEYCDVIGFSTFLLVKDTRWLKCLVLNMICMQLDPRRCLEKLGLETTPISTKGYKTLLSLVEDTVGDSFDLSSFSADCIVSTKSSNLKMKNRSLLCQKGPILLEKSKNSDASSPLSKTQLERFYLAFESMKKQLSADCIVSTESSYLKMKDRSLLCQRGLYCQRNLRTMMRHYLFQNL